MKIEQYRFGEIIINGSTYREDIQIITGRVVPGWFRKSGHRVEPADVSDMLAEPPDIVLLGKGEPGRMEATPALVEQLMLKQIELIEKPTKEAVRLFNELSQKKKNIAAGFHLTC